MKGRKRTAAEWAAFAKAWNGAEELAHVAERYGVTNAQASQLGHRARELGHTLQTFTHGRGAEGRARRSA